MGSLGSRWRAARDCSNEPTPKGTTGSMKKLRRQMSTLPLMSQQKALSVPVTPVASPGELWIHSIESIGVAKGHKPDATWTGEFDNSLKREGLPEIKLTIVQLFFEEILQIQTCFSN